MQSYSHLHVCPFAAEAAASISFAVAPLRTTRGSPNPRAPHARPARAPEIRADRMRALADDLVRLRGAVLVTTGASLRVARAFSDR